MQRTYRIRRETLRRYMNEDCGGKVIELANRCGKSEATVSRLLNASDPKTIGEKLAREIETILNKPQYWLDGLSDATIWPFPSIDINRIHSLTKQQKEKLENSIEAVLQLIEPGSPPKESVRRRGTG